MATPWIAAASLRLHDGVRKVKRGGVSPRVPPSELTAVPASLSATDVA